jgi:hypothetical protein
MLGKEVLQVTAGPKTGALSGRWRKLHDYELRDIYYGIQIAENEMNETCRMRGKQ